MVSFLTKRSMTSPTYCIIEVTCGVQAAYKKITEETAVVIVEKYLKFEFGKEEFALSQFEIEFVEGGLVLRQTYQARRLGHMPLI